MVRAHTPTAVKPTTPRHLAVHVPGRMRKSKGSVSNARIECELHLT